MGILTTLQELEAIYASPAEASIVKQVDAIIPHYRRLIEASPFAVLATAGPEGLDCSPEGGFAGFCPSSRREDAAPPGSTGKQSD
jgi:predicted pyridoxine 5'-phosphate oxidase superfamily flavin-nucleotide-binding protein